MIKRDVRQVLSYDSVGTVAAPATLTAAYAGNSQEHLAKGFRTINFNIRYTPKAGESNRYIEVLVEDSNDDGTSYEDQGAKQYTPSTINVYDNQELTFPGSKVTTGGTTYTVSVPVEVNGEKVKVSVRENGTTDFGTVSIISTLLD